MTHPLELVRSYLAQRLELGETELILDGCDAAELLRLVSEGKQQPPARAAVAPAPAPGAGDLRQRERSPAVAVPTEERIRSASLDELRAVALGCPRCRLCETRSHVVFGEGSPAADLMVVGEAPGADEDRTGRPFVGRAGKLLDLMLESVGFSRDSVYICNVLKCRPPGNRDPHPVEIEACSPYLRRQIELVAPGAILTVGTFATQTLLGTSTSIGRLRGQVHDYGGVPLVPSYHPAALLRNRSWIRPAWEDLQRLRALLDRS